MACCIAVPATQVSAAPLFKWQAADEGRTHSILQHTLRPTALLVASTCLLARAACELVAAHCQGAGRSTAADDEDRPLWLSQPSAAVGLPVPLMHTNFSQKVMCLSFGLSS
jgi:hypothetical protein